MKKNIKNEIFLKDLEIIKEFQLEEIKGGADAQLAKACAACCLILGGGGSAPIPPIEVAI
ncbi:MAG TPA: hypothetical protein PK860_01995 [Paludibacteraceae bacterium]|nr:hypothetical protein [Paludibacteraceae bacterium]HOL00300.1 hypothetical protein [Paludibacteraceae bacterium]